MVVIQFPGRRPVVKTRSDVLGVSGPRAPRRRRRLGNPEMRRVLLELTHMAWTTENCLRWLAEVVRSDPDGRGIIALLEDDADWPMFQSREEVEAVRCLIDAALQRYARTLQSKPVLVD